MAETKVIPVTMMFKDEDHGYGGNVELEHYWAPCSGSLGKIYEVWIEFLPTPSLARNKRNIWGWRNIHGQSSSENIQFWKASAHHCFRILRRKIDSQDQLFTVSLSCRLQSKKQKVKGIPEAAARNIQTHFSQEKKEKGTFEFGEEKYSRLLFLSYIRNVFFSGNNFHIEERRRFTRSRSSFCSCIISEKQKELLRPMQERAHCLRCPHRVNPCLCCLSSPSISNLFCLTFDE